MNKIFLSLFAIVLFGSIASAQDSYRIRSGDLLQIEVLEDASLNRSVLVLPDGSITVPLVGGVNVSGKTLGAVQSEITAGLAPNFATSPNVFVSVATLSAPTAQVSAATIDVFVMGEVAKPGKVAIAPGTSVLQFLAESGGFTKFASKKRIQVRRANRKTGQSSVYGFNYRAVEDGSSAVNSIILKEGDVIVVPERRLFE